MKMPEVRQQPLGQPLFLAEANELAIQLQRLTTEELAGLMRVSDQKAAEVSALYQNWTDNLSDQVAAIDAFVGDIFSGLRAHTWSAADRQYAQDHLLLLSGLYGVLRACDGVLPYRLEMGYKLPDGGSLYDFWGDKLAKSLPENIDYIVNVSSVEYTKALLPYVAAEVVTPKFLTVSPKTAEPTFVTVHAKIARGAYARWMITERVKDIEQLDRFDDLGYRYDASRSTTHGPVYVCQEFGGLGLSVRLR